MKTEEMLDNPVWYSLIGPHAHMSIGDDHARRYLPDIGPIAGISDNSEAAYQSLENIIQSGDIIALFEGFSILEREGWETLFQVKVVQRVCEELIQPARSPEVDFITLTPEDVPEMQALVELTEPGPFMNRTIELGNYMGIRQNGQLVAMAGQRMKFAQYCEISLVCTHPDFQGRGYGSFLSWKAAQGIIDRGERPFLHHIAPNTGAARIYEVLGFRERHQFDLVVVKRIT